MHPLYSTCAGNLPGHQPRGKYDADLNAAYGDYVLKVEWKWGDKVHFGKVDGEIRV